MPRPDFSQLDRVLRRSGEPDYVPFFELYADGEIMQAILGKPLTTESYVEYQRMMGYDFANFNMAFGYQRHMLTAEDTAALKRDARSFVDDNHGTIETRRDFDAYAWPRVTDAVAAGLPHLESLVPDGMKILLAFPGGVLENVMWLMGYIPFSYAVYDDLPLVDDMFERIGTDLCDMLRTTLERADRGKLGGVLMGDDMGFNHSIMISADLMRRYVFPWQKRLVALAHAYDVPFILHSCGNLTEIMDDLIDDVGIDAKHSYEDAILPVAEAKRRYGDRIAILGGVDVHYLCTHTPEEVSDYTTRVLDACMPGGGYALGTGNSVANYVPVENFRAMLDAGHRWRARG